ncbi:methanethiol S-methyltransferase [Wenzhouxiangella sp. EGI_FJ10305]|uniref:methanethiol S-methyltransferase n=1 Tax=Wenzhouxiangella sp. EGI_FJ10305 TaxID=3243768 RepID=UPI0035DD7311
MQRFLILLFGIAAYLVFLPTFLYLIAFVGNLQTTALVETIPALTWLVPQSVSYGRETGPVGLAVVINLALIALFGLQHSVMARSGFKDWLKKMLPASAERSVYVLISSLLLILLFWQWRPMGPVIWSVESGAGQAMLWTLFAVGFGITFISTYLIDHFDLFGLKQIWSQFRGRKAQPPRFVTPLFYRIVRHPLYLGFLIAFWTVPHVTLGHVLFAGGMTVYILIGIQLEERDLVRYLGKDYQRYQKQVPQLVPVPGKAWRDDETLEGAGDRA